MLVAKDKIGYSKICKQMFGLLEDEDRTSETIGHDAAFGDPQMEMGKHFNGFRNEIS